MMFLIWSNEKAAWRTQDGGYTWLIERATRYERTHALQLIGPTNIVSRGLYHLRETMVPAPEEANNVNGGR